MSTIWKIVVAVIITAIVVGGGVYLWQQPKDIAPEVLKYDNEKYGFSLDLPNEWSDYKVVEEVFVEEILSISFDFRLDDETMFIISVYTKDEFAKIDSNENPIIYNTKIGENNSFVFTAMGSQDNSLTLYPRRQEVSEIVDTFELY